MKRFIALMLAMVTIFSFVACGSTPVETEQEGTVTPELSKQIDNETIYDWLLENGKLIDGTTISYTINGNGNSLNVAAGEDKTVWLSFASISPEGLEVSCTMPLVSKKTLSFECKILDETETGQKFDYKLDKASFTTNSPIEKKDAGFSYIDGEPWNYFISSGGKLFKEYFSSAAGKKVQEEIPQETLDRLDSINNISSQLAQQSICNMLDLMSTDLCDLWGINLTDLGFEMYLPSSEPSVIA